jgi:hypothetical protein
MRTPTYNRVKFFFIATDGTYVSYLGEIMRKSTAILSFLETNKEKQGPQRLISHINAQDIYKKAISSGTTDTI